MTSPVDQTTRVTRAPLGQPDRVRSRRAPSSIRHARKTPICRSDMPLRLAPSRCFVAERGKESHSRPAIFPDDTRRKLSREDAASIHCPVLRP